MQEIRSNRAFLGFICLFVLASISISLLGEIFNRSLLDTVLPPDAGWLSYLIWGVVIFFLFLWVAMKTARKAGEIVGVEVSAAFADRQAPLPFLVMGYSPREIKDPDVSALIGELMALGVETVVQPTENFESSCTTAKWAKVSPNRWQQNLRAAWHHRDKLKAIYVLDPDRDQFQDFKSYMDIAFGALGRNVEIHRIVSEEGSSAPFATYDKSGRGIERTYENYEYVYEGLNRGVEMISLRPDIDQLLPTASTFSKWFGLNNRQRLIEALICVDATAGQKVFSIAAAVLTLNRALKFSYVTTGQGKAGGHVRFYDTNVRIAGSGL